MADLSTKQRKKLPDSVFGLPKQRKYPITDRGHAISAKSYAQKEYDKGNLSKAQLDKIDRKADKMLGEKSNSSNKDKTMDKVRKDKKGMRTVKEAEISRKDITALERKMQAMHSKVERAHRKAEKAHEHAMKAKEAARMAKKKR